MRYTGLYRPSSGARLLLFATQAASRGIANKTITKCDPTSGLGSLCRAGFGVPTVGEEGLEPSRSFEHELLGLACLPIPSLARRLA